MERSYFSPKDDNSPKMRNFEFATASRIIFGPGKFQETGDLAKFLGKSAMIVSGLSDNLTIPLVELLSKAEIKSRVFPISKEPTISIIQHGVNEIRKNGCDIVIGFGGGSAIDAGKAIAALATNPGEPLDYLEIIGAGKPIDIPPLPIIAIPTTAGTGSEVTRNAVLASPEHQIKVSLRSPLMLPRIAIIDPRLTLSLPPSVTASTGLDALTQCIEPFVSHLGNPLTDGICQEGIHRAAGSLQRACENSDDLSARTNMSLVSLFGGLALANAKLGAVHGFAGTLGGMYPTAPHGVICGRLLPIVMEANVKALYSREPQNLALTRFVKVGQILTGDPEANANDGVAWIRDLVKELNIVPLSEFGIKENDISTIIQKSKNASSMKGNPIKLTSEELHWILEKAIRNHSTD